MERRVNRLSWLIGGAQGSGVDSAASMFAKACAFGGLHIYGQREYHSNIMGEHSYYPIRVSDQPVRAVSSRIDLLVTFDAETAFLHALSVVPGGGIIYDPKLARTPIDRVPTMEARAREDLKGFLEEQGAGDTLGDLLKVVGGKGVQLYPVPYEDLMQQLSEETGEPLSKLKKTANTMAVAASCALLQYGVEWLKKALSDVFRGKQKVIELNVKAAELVYQHVENAFEGTFPVKLEPIATDEPRLLLTGNQAVALGKLIAGCTFQTYYPISPATDESVYLESHQMFALKGGSKANEQQQGAIVVVQTEDEISAIDMAIGAAIAGARAATATSGPGFSLMVEGLGFAAACEVPVVITLYQRGGPSTGLPTRSEQGDLWFAVFAGHGEGPRLVLASGDPEEAFYDALRAFNWAEKFQMPVIHLMDKSLASATQTQPLFDLEGVRLERGKLLTEDELAQRSEDGTIQRFQFTEDGISPRTVFGTQGGISWLTSDEHNEWGHITEDPVIRDRMMEKRLKKLETAARQIPTSEKLNVFGDPDAEIVILSWGSPKAAILEAMEGLMTEGFSVKFVQVRLIWPLPADEIAEHLGGARLKIAVENNFSGQLAGLVRQQTGIAVDHKIVKYNGRPMTVEELHEALKAAIARQAPEKVVLTYGA
jgi:2-oxoglutarate ferredoxin oxidoreductase subunit alpha